MHIKEGITYHQRKEDVLIDFETGAIKLGEKCKLKS